MPEGFQIALILLYAYLVGSVPTAYVLGRLIKGIDIRQYGSGNLGGSNVWLHVAKWAIVPLGLFDIFVKGASPLWIARYGLDLDVGVQASAGLLAMAGHNWSLYLKFVGGRGIGTAVGVLFALYPPRFPLELFAFVAVSLTGWAFFRSSAVWVLVSLALLPFWSLLWHRPLEVVLLMVGIVAITAIKRMTANPGARPVGVSLGTLLARRLLFDRDIVSHDEWVYRQPPQGPSES